MPPSAAAPSLEIPPEPAIADAMVGGQPHHRCERSHFACDDSELALACADRFNRGVEQINLAGDVADQAGETFDGLRGNAELANLKVGRRRHFRGHRLAVAERDGVCAVSIPLPAKHLCDAPDSRPEKS